MEHFYSLLGKREIRREERERIGSSRWMGCGVGLVFTFLFWHLQDLGGSPTLFGKFLT